MPASFTHSLLSDKIIGMRKPVPWQGWAGLVRQSLILGLVGAFVLTFLSPVVDHHFAERQIGHSHVYLASHSAGYGHPDLHPFENSHLHDESSKSDFGQDGILYQSSGDAPSDPGSTSGGAVVNNTLPLRFDSPDLLSRAVPAGDSRYRGNFVFPPKKPPRA